ncbi:hypothetical protein GCM10010377_76370 [Streptomyces viridiviolaceus]|nr:hypothetical protein GCM10010377_76370 [Streptomyces viridiviolaceus]
MAGRRSVSTCNMVCIWGASGEYAEHDSAAAELKAIVELVDTYGPQQITAAVKQMVDEDRARVEAGADRGRVHADGGRSRGMWSTCGGGASDVRGGDEGPRGDGHDRDPVA